MATCRAHSVFFDGQWYQPGDDLPAGAVAGLKEQGIDADDAPKPKKATKKKTSKK